MSVPPETAPAGSPGGHDPEAAGSSPVLPGRVGPVLRLLCGHVLDLLRQLPERSVHCVVTSPPYLWLRDYGTEPQVWGGAAGCAHEWAGGTRRRVGRNDTSPAVLARRAATYGTGTGAGSLVGNALAEAVASCVLCGAWRGSLGLEPTVDLYVEHVVQVFREVWRVLRDDGSLWVNLGDSFAPSSTSNHGRGKARPATNGRGEPQVSTGWENPPRFKAPGLKPKDLVGVPWRVALALQADGWYLRRDIVWNKLNPMPESVTDRPSTAHEYVFLLTKRAKYFYDAEAVREPLSEAVKARPLLQVFGSREDVGQPGASLPRRGSVTKKGALEGGHGTNGRDGAGMRMPEKWDNPAGRNLRSVWSLASSPFPEAHFATYPVEIPTTAIKAGTSERGCCPACGAPWARVASKHFSPQEDVSEARGVRGAPGQKPLDRANGRDGYPRGSTSSITTGWRPTCSCPVQEPIPCTVLDTFNGAGTSGLAAARLGRSYTGIDLRQEYCGMTQRRIEGDAPLLNVVEPEDEDDRQGLLFGGSE